MTEDLYKRIDVAETFSSDLAHEIRNPLTSLKGASEVLDNTLDSEKRNLFNVLSTFAGGGGSSTGYRLAGGKILCVNEFVEATTSVVPSVFFNVALSVFVFPSLISFSLTPRLCVPRAGIALECARLEIPKCS